MSKIKKIVIPAPEEGWEIWNLSGDSATFDSLISGKWPSLSQDCRVYLPLSHYLSRVEEVFKSDSETELQTVQTNLEVDYAVDDPAHETCALQLADQKDQRLYMGLVLSDDAGEKAWIDCDFDISARAYEVGNEILIWREHGRWVYALYAGNKPAWFDVLGKGGLAVQLESLMLMLEPRLSMLGIQHSPLMAMIDPGEVEVDIESCQNALGLRVTKVNRGSLIKVKAKGLTILPKSVRGYRKDRRDNNLRLIALAAIVVLAAAAAGFLFWKRQALVDEVAEQRKIINNFEPIVQDNDLHIQKWAELEPIVEGEWPLELYRRAILAMTSNKQISLKAIKIEPDYMLIEGLSEDFDPGKTLAAGLQKDEILGTRFEWTTPNPRRVKGVHQFRYEGRVRKVEEF